MAKHTKSLGRGVVIRGQNSSGVLENMARVMEAGLGCVWGASSDKSQWHRGKVWGGCEQRGKRPGAHTEPAGSRLLPTRDEPVHLMQDYSAVFLQEDGSPTALLRADYDIGLWWGLAAVAGDWFKAQCDQGWDPVCVQGQGSDWFSM